MSDEVYDAEEDKIRQRQSEWLAKAAEARDVAREMGYTLEHDRECGVEHLLYEALEQLFYGKSQNAAGLILSTLELLANPRPSNLVDHARSELERVGEDQDTVEGLVKVVQDFADMGHSGGSGPYAISYLAKLLLFEPLTPLTDDPLEWRYVGEEQWGDKGGIWQSTRNPAAFSKDGGRRYYLVSDGSNSRRVKKWYRAKRTGGVRPAAKKS